MTRRALAPIAIVLALGAPPAAAQQSNAPPGNSGIDQYLETVPDSTGSRPTRRGDGADPAVGAPVLTNAQRRSLSAHGEDGRAALALAERYGVQRRERRDNRRPVDGGAGVAGGTSAETSSGRSAIDSLVRAVVPSSDSGGLGPLLPTILVATTTLAVCAAVTRRRRVR